MPGWPPRSLNKEIRIGSLCSNLSVAAQINLEVTYMPIDRWMDTEIVVHIYNGILLSYEKECIRVSPNEVDEPRTYYTEWNKSERKRQMLYINAYVWNLERWY